MGAQNTAPGVQVVRCRGIVAGGQCSQRGKSPFDGTVVNGSNRFLHDRGVAVIEVAGTLHTLQAPQCQESPKSNSGRRVEGQGGEIGFGSLTFQPHHQGVSQIGIVVVVLPQLRYQRGSGAIVLDVKTSQAAGCMETHPDIGVVQGVPQGGEHLVCWAIR